jgi:hypothetical protein
MALGGLVVRLALDFASYTQGLDKSSQEALKFAKNAQDAMDRAKRATSDFLGGVVSGAVAAVASYQTVSAVIDGVRQAIDRLDEISKTAARIGVASDQLQELAYAGELADVGLEALATSSKKLSQAMLEAATGGKEQAAIFRAIGVEVKNADGTLRASNEVMADVADVFAGMEDGAVKTALAVKIFGKAGADMIPLLNGGKQALQEAKEEAHKFGLVLGEETLKNAEAFNDNITRLGKIAQGTFSQIASGVLPVLVSFSEALVEATSDVNSVNAASQRLAKDGSITSWAKSAAIGLTYVMDAGEGVWRVLKGLGQLIGGLAAAAANNISAVATAFAKLQTGDFSGAFAALKSGVSGLGSIISAVGDDLSQTFGEQMLGTKIRARLQDLAQFGNAAADVGNKAKPSKALLDALTDPKGASDAQKAMEKWVEELTKYQNELDAAASNAEKLTKGESMLAQLVANNTKEVQKLSSADRERLKVMLQTIIASEKRNAAIERERKANADAAKAHSEYITDLAKGVDRLREEARAEQERTAEIGLTKEAIAELRAARLDEQATILEGIGIKQLDKNADEQAYNLYKQQAQALRDRAKAMRDGAVKTEGIEALKKIDDYLDPSKAKSFGEALTDAFEGAGNALAKLGNVFDTVAKKQAEQNKMVEALRNTKGISQEDRIKRETDLAQRQSELQIDAYASMAGAAKGFFEEGSKGYKTLEAAETAFRAYQLASDLVKGASAAAVAIANQAQGEPYTAWARMAAMAAAMAALGFAVSGGFNKSSGAQATAQTRQGGAATGRIVTPDQADRSSSTYRGGTVFGDDQARSESIANSIDILADASKIELTYSRNQLAALEAIRDSLSGLGNLIVRSVGGGLTTGKNFGIQTGTLSVNQGDPLAKAIGLGGLDKFIGDTSVLFGAVGKALHGLWGKVKQEIVDSGLSILGNVSDVVVQQYVDFATTKSSFFGLVKKTTTGTETGPVEQQIADQFGLIFQSIGDTLTATAGVLGRDGEAFSAALQSFVIDLPRLSLKDLKGEELQEAIAAAIGGEADRLAATVLPGLVEFQQIGEGYYETLIRVASGIDVANYQLELLGITAVAYTDVIRRQGDVGAEIVRQSIVAAETAGGALSSVGTIVNTLSGSAEELAETYTALVDVRDALKLVGLSGEALTVQLIRGAGGLDNLGSALDTYFSEFFSEQEQLAARTSALASEFTALGVAVPASRDEFKALVNQLVAGGDATAALAAKVLGLAGAFDDVADAFEQRQREIADTRTGLEIELARALGDETAALTLERAAELEALAKLDPALAALKQTIYDVTDAAIEGQKIRDLFAGLDSIAPDFLSGADLIDFKGRRIADELGFAGFGDVPLDRILGSTPAEFRAFWESLDTDGKAALQKLYPLFKDLWSTIEDENISELIDGIAGSADEMLAAYYEINPAADTLVESWRKNKTAMEELQEALDDIAGTKAVSAIDKLRSDVAARDALRGVIANNQDAAFDLLVGQGGQKAIDALKRREAELTTQFSASGSAEDAAELTRTVLRRIQLEGSEREKVLKAQADDRYKAELEVFNLQKAQHDAQRAAAEESIDASKRMLELSKAIPEFLGGLRAGSLSNLSFTDRLSQQRSLFERSLETGNDPQGALTAYLQQAQQLYGGATKQYSDIFTAALAQYEASITSAAEQAPRDIALAEAQLATLDAMAPKLEEVMVDVSGQQIEALGNLELLFKSKENSMTKAIDEQTLVLQAQLTELKTQIGNQERQITQAGEAYTNLISGTQDVITAIRMQREDTDLVEVLST